MKRTNFFTKDDTGNPVEETAYCSSFNKFFKLIKLIKKHKYKVLKIKLFPVSITYKLPP